MLPVAAVAAVAVDAGLELAAVALTVVKSCNEKSRVSWV